MAIQQESLSLRKQTRQTRDLESNICKELEYEAVILETDYETQQRYKKEIIRQISDEHYYHSIDKISFSLSRDYLNEEQCNYKYKNGIVSIMTRGNFFTINLNREYIPLDKNLNEYTHRVFRYLAYINLFKLPVRKTVIDYTKGGIYTEERFEENRVKTAQEFIEKIYAKRKLKCIELCFDMHLPIRKYLNRDDFNIIEGSLYSKDYKIYRSNNRKKSMLCIYNKAKEQTERKRRLMKCVLERLEIRLFANSFSIMNSTGGESTE